MAKIKNTKTFRVEKLLAGMWTEITTLEKFNSSCKIKHTHIT